MATKVKPTRLQITGTPQAGDVPLYVDQDTFQWGTGGASFGRFLSLWNSATGLPISFPEATPYTYITGDYFIVEVVSSATPPVNYKPDGSTYSGTASSVTESDEVEVGDVYVYDGSVWLLQSNHGKTVSFANIAGQPTDNANLATALSGKLDTSALSDTNYGGAWSGDTTHAATKNAIYTKIHTMDVEIGNKAADNTVVKLSGNQTINDTKTFSTSPVVPSKTADATNTGTAIATEAQVYKKQDTLVSGTNIKTINNTSILGSGDLTVGGDVGISTDTGNLLTAGDKLWFGSESDFSGISTPDSSTLYIQYVSDSPTPPSPRTPGVNTIAYYPLTQNANDYSGNNRNGTASNVSYTTLSGVDCALFNGTSSNIIGNWGLGVSDITISAWINSSSGTNSLSIVAMCGGSESLQMWLRNGVTAQGDIWNGSGDTTVSDGSVRDGNRHNLIATYDRQNLTFYVDGILIGQSAETVSISINNMGIGRHYSVGGGQFAFTGYISNVIYEDKIRTAQDVSDYYNSTKGNYGIS